MLNYFETYKYINKNEKLSVKRHPLFEHNKFMKFFIYVFSAFWAIYFMFFGFAIGQIDNLNYEIFDILDGHMVLFLAVDFLIRLIMQEIPAQRLKPYKLLPLNPKYVIDVFLWRLILSPFNLFWLFFWIPLSLFSVFKFYGLFGFLFYNFGWVVLYILNSFWFLLWRTVARSNAIYYVIPISIYGIVAYLGIFASFSNNWLFDFCLWLGRTFCTLNPIGIVFLLIFMTILFIVNRKYQFKCVYDEISDTEKSTATTSSKMSWLDRFGIIGEYLKLEIKSIKRNKVVRKSFVLGFLCVLIFSLLFAFTDVYDNSQFMEAFICVYCFACLGTITLTSILSAEGNYMDFLNSRKESIYYLLKAKYLFNCVMLVIPFVFALLPVIKGKFMLIEILGCMFFVSGCVFPFLFQQAVYNKNTMPLNKQIIKQGNNSKTQMIVSLVALFVPMIIMNILFTIFVNKTTPSLVMLFLGITGTALNHIWIKNIYNRFKKHRYINLEGFRNTKKI